MDDYDLELKNLLIKWKLEHFYSKFKEQNITMYTINILTPTHIEKLLADFTIGDQATFENNLKKWKNQPLVHSESPNISFSTTESIETNNNIISVMEIISNTYNGKEILNFYAKNKILHEEQRNLLICTVTEFLEARGRDFSISECSEIEKQICSIFPTEHLEFYGKIYNKLAYLKRLTKNIFKKDESTSPENMAPDLEDDCTFYIQQIKSGSITADEFDLYWRKCASFRFKQIIESKSTSEIFNLWPEYIKPSGFLLIDIDFSLKFPNAKSLQERWSQFGDKIICLLKTKISNASVSKQLQMTETIDNGMYDCIQGTLRKVTASLQQYKNNRYFVFVKK